MAVNRELISKFAVQALADTGVEGGWGNCCQSSAGDYPSFGIQGWEGNGGGNGEAGNTFLQQLASFDQSLSMARQFVGMTYSQLEQTGGRATIVNLLSSPKGKEAQMTIAAHNMINNYWPALESYMSDVDSVETGGLIFIMSWMGSGPYACAPFIAKRPHKTLDQIYSAFKSEYGPAVVESIYWEGYARRSDIIYSWIKQQDLSKMPSGSTGDINLPGMSAAQEKALREKIIARARQYASEEHPYMLGAADDSTYYFDCGLFTKKCLNDCGVTMETREADGQAIYIRNTCNGLYTCPNEQAVGGDLVFFKNTYSCETYENCGITHVGIVTGNGMMIDCGSSSGISEREISCLGAETVFGRLPEIKGGVIPSSGVPVGVGGRGGIQSAAGGIRSVPVGEKTVMLISLPVGMTFCEPVYPDLITVADNLPSWVLSIATENGNTNRAAAAGTVAPPATLASNQLSGQTGNSTMRGGYIYTPPSMSTSSSTSSSGNSTTSSTTNSVSAMNNIVSASKPDNSDLPEIKGKQHD